MTPADDAETENGLILNSFYLPEEVIAYILSYVDPKSLVFQCRSVCRSWKYIIDTHVWKILLRSVPNNRSLSRLPYSDRVRLNFPWNVYYAIFAHDPFDRNLLKNNCGQERMNHWTLPGNRKLGNGFWEIEAEPIGSDPIPSDADFGGFTSCFVTSFHTCKKSQLINLREYGISNKIMDVFKPTIVVSEWYAGRFDCGCVYTLIVSLLNENKEVVLKYCEGQKRGLLGQPWEKVEYSLSNYDAGVRYIEFTHEGKDTQFWAGHYGSKMAGGVVKLMLPKPLDLNLDEMISTPLLVD